MDNEKAKFKTELKRSFDSISLPIDSQDRFKEMLEEKKKEYFTNFDKTTAGVDQESKYKLHARKELESFASEENTEINKKNEGISFIIPPIVCNVSAWQGCIYRAVNTGQCMVCVVSNELLFGVHILFFSDLYTF